MKRVSTEVCTGHAWGELRSTIVMDLKSTLLLTGGSAGSFKLLNAVIRVLPTPQPAQRKAWKWRNVSTSLTHSCLTGAGAVLWFVEARSSQGSVDVCFLLVWYSLFLWALSPCSFYRHPQMMEDLISFCSLHSHSLYPQVMPTQTHAHTHTCKCVYIEFQKITW